MVLDDLRQCNFSCPLWEGLSAKLSGLVAVGRFTHYIALEEMELVVWQIRCIPTFGRDVSDVGCLGCAAMIH